MTALTRTVLTTLAAASLLFTFEDQRILIYGLSYTYHPLNLHAYVLRRSDASTFSVRSFQFRAVADGVLAFTQHVMDPVCYIGQMADIESRRPASNAVFGNHRNRQSFCSQRGSEVYPARLSRIGGA